MKTLIKKVGVGIGLFTLPFMPLKAEEGKKDVFIPDATIGRTFNFYSSNSILKEKTFIKGIVGGLYLSNTKTRIGYFFEWKTTELKANDKQKVHLVMLKTGLDYNHFLNKSEKIKSYIGAEVSYNELAYNNEEYHKLNGFAVSPKVGVDILLIKNTKLKLTLEGKAEILKLKQYFKKYPENDVKMKYISLSAKVRF